MSGGKGIRTEGKFVRAAGRMFQYFSAWFRRHQLAVMPEKKLFVLWWTLIGNPGLRRKKC